MGNVTCIRIHLFTAYYRVHMEGSLEEQAPVRKAKSPPLRPFETPRPILGSSLGVCRRSNMLKKLTCIAGSSYSSGALYEIIP